MKKFIKALLIITLAFCLCSCKQEKVNIEPLDEDFGFGSKEDNDDTSQLDINVEEFEDGKTYVFSKFIDNVDDLKKLDITDEYQGVCAVIFALAVFETNPDKAREMLEYINGPEDVSEFDIDFIENQIDQYPYVMRSYFDGTSPEEDYELKDISITIKENIYSRDEKGYVKMWLHSTGADSDRYVMLRKKESTNEWFLFSDTYKGLMAGIRAPKIQDKWS